MWRVCQAAAPPTMVRYTAPCSCIARTLPGSSPPLPPIARLAHVRRGVQQYAAAEIHRWWHLLVEDADQRGVSDSEQGPGQKHPVAGAQFTHGALVQWRREPNLSHNRHLR